MDATFSPSYDWQEVPPNCDVQPGLEVRMSIGREGRKQKLARIPRSWQLRLWLGRDFGNFTADVTRQTTVGDIVARICKFCNNPDPSIVFLELRDGSDSIKLGDKTTAEDALLFQRMSDIVVVGLQEGTTSSPTATLPTATTTATATTPSTAGATTSISIHQNANSNMAAAAATAHPSRAFNFNIAPLPDPDPRGIARKPSPKERSPTPLPFASAKRINIPPVRTQDLSPSSPRGVDQNSPSSTSSEPTATQESSNNSTTLGIGGSRVTQQQDQPAPFSPRLRSPRHRAPTPPRASRSVGRSSTSSHDDKIPASELNRRMDEVSEANNTNGGSGVVGGNGSASTSEHYGVAATLTQSLHTRPFTHATSQPPFPLHSEIEFQDKANTTKKVSVIGIGGLGFQIAQALLNEGTCEELALVDVQSERVKAAATELTHGAAMRGVKTNIISGVDARLVEDSQVVVIAAAAKPSPPLNDLQGLIRANGVVVSAIIRDVVRFCPAAKVIVASEPVHQLSRIAWQETMWPQDRVFGLGVVVEWWRLRCLLASQLGVAPEVVSVWLLGASGDQLVPVWSCATVEGVPLESFCASVGTNYASLTHECQSQVSAFMPKQKATTSWCRGMWCARLVKSILADQRVFAPLSVCAQGRFGCDHDVFASLPSLVGGGGVVSVVEVPMNDKETSQLQAVFAQQASATS